MIDSHTHLDSTPGEVAEIVARAREAGLNRILTIGTDPESCGAAIQAAEQEPGVYAAVGHHPNSASTFDDEIATRLRELAAHERVRAIGETGLDYYRDRADPEDQARAFAAQIELARETQLPLVIHTRAADDDTIATLARDAQGIEVIMHCFSMPGRLEECLGNGWWISFAGNVTYPKAYDLAWAAETVPLDRMLVETDAPYLTPQAVRKERNQPAYVVHTARFVAERRGIPYEELEAAVEANAAKLFPLVSELPAQPSLRRLKAFGVRPNRELGQNFLIDSNILDVIARAAHLSADDVVLEVGGGLGVLSEFLAERVAHVHVVEVDRGLEPPLRDALDAHPNATLHFADAVRLDLATLQPAPAKVVANLPYGVAATVILRTIEELPGVTTWVAMVQREVGERLAAKPGTGAYGVPSVLAQLACDVRVLRQISRNVFFPVPNVDSVLVGLTRRGPAPPAELRALVQQGFAHRRKALPRSLALASSDPELRDRARAALEAIGRPPDARAETLAPADWVALYEAL